MNKPLRWWAQRIAWRLRERVNFGDDRKELACKANHDWLESVTQQDAAILEPFLAEMLQHLEAKP